MRFVFRLESLLKYRKHRRDVLRAAWAGLTAEKNALLAQREALSSRRAQQKDEMRRLFGEGILNVAASVARSAHAVCLDRELDAFDKNLQALDQRMQNCRQELTTAEHEVDSLEKQKDRQRHEFEYEHARREQTEIEETWRSAHSAKYAS